MMNDIRRRTLLPRRHRPHAWGLALFVLGAIGSTASADVNPARVDMVASVKAVVPGRPFEIAVRFEIDDGWHIYWKNPGQAGQPPVVTWNLPKGFEVGPFRFPVPKRHVSPGSIVTNILEGEPILLATITPPASLPADQPVVLQGKLRYLVCRETCLIRFADLKVELPVAEPGSEPQSANEKLFARAKRALPETKSKHLSIRARVEPPSPVVGQSFELRVTIDIRRGLHIQSHTPLNPAFIPADLFLAPPKGVVLREPVFPPPKLRRVKILGQLSEYTGKITITVPGTVEERPSGSPAIEGVFKYQACTDKGQCYPPTGVAFSLPFGGREKQAGTSPSETSGGATTAATASGTRQVGGSGGPEPAGESTVAEDAPAAAPNAPARKTEQAAGKAGGLEGFLAGLGVPGQLLICFLYGLFINATPCVLPILSIKVMDFVRQAHASRARTMVLGLAFGAGVMIFFVVLGLLAAQGKNLLQYPVAVIALGAVVTALALSMLGVYTLQPPSAATRIDAALQKDGVWTSFGKGALAPVLGFACTAPMMVGGLAWATRQTPQ
ncbi:MAG: hypothetical protein D6788_00620, partial [Planctomycetota bacterium]